MALLKSGTHSGTKDSLVGRARRVEARGPRDRRTHPYSPQLGVAEESRSTKTKPLPVGYPVMSSVWKEKEKRAWKATEDEADTARLTGRGAKMQPCQLAASRFAATPNGGASRGVIRAPSKMEKGSEPPKPRQAMLVLVYVHEGVAGVGVRAGKEPLGTAGRDKGGRGKEKLLACAWPSTSSGELALPVQSLKHRRILQAVVQHLLPTSFHT